MALPILQFVRRENMMSLQVTFGSDNYCIVVHGEWILNVCLMALCKFQVVLGFGIAG